MLLPVCGRTQYFPQRFYITWSLAWVGKASRFGGRLLGLKPSRAHGLKAAVCDTAPKPLDRAEKKAARPEDAEKYLSCEHQNCDREAFCGTDLPIERQPIAVENERANDGLKNVIAERQAASGCKWGHPAANGRPAEAPPRQKRRATATKYAESRTEPGEGGESSPECPADTACAKKERSRTQRPGSTQRQNETPRDAWECR